MNIFNTNWVKYQVIPLGFGIWGSVLMSCAFAQEQTAATASPLVDVLAAEMAITQNAPQEGIAYYEALLKRYPHHPQVLSRLVGIMVNDYQYERALPYMQQWLAQENTPRVLEYGALVYSQTAYWDEADKVLQALRQYWRSQQEEPYQHMISVLKDRSTSRNLATLMQRLAVSDQKNIIPWQWAISLLAEDKAYEEALGVLETAPPEIKQHSEVIILHAKLLYSLQRAEDAIDLLSSALKVDSAVNLRLAYVSFLVDNYQLTQAQNYLLEWQEEGVKAFTAWDEKTQNVWVDAMTLLLAIAYDLKDIYTAESTLRILYQKIPNAPYLYYNYARLALLNGQYEEAKSLLTKVSQADWYTKVQVLLAEIALNQEDWVSFDRIFEKLRHNQPEDKRMGWWLQQNQLLTNYERYDIAWQQAQYVYSLYPHDERVQYMYAMSAVQYGVLEPFNDIMQANLAKNPDNAVALNAYGYSLLEYADASEWPKACAMIDKAHEIAPEDVAILDSKGWCHFKNQEWEEAGQYLQRAYYQFKDAEVIGHYVQWLLKTGKKEQAQPILSQALRMYPHSSLIQGLAPYLEAKAVDVPLSISKAISNDDLQLGSLEWQKWVNEQVVKDNEARAHGPDVGSEEWCGMIDFLLFNRQSNLAPCSTNWNEKVEQSLKVQK